MFAAAVMARVRVCVIEKSAWGKKREKRSGGELPSFHQHHCLAPETATASVPWKCCLMQQRHLLPQQQRMEERMA
jgi:hypothetical protein